MGIFCCAATGFLGIDEAFPDLTGMSYDVVAYSQHIRETVRRWTGIPVAIGLGPTKTLAKVANMLSKKNPDLDGVLNFGASLDSDGLLEQVPVEDVWGIGRRYAISAHTSEILQVATRNNICPDVIQNSHVIL